MHEIVTVHGEAFTAREVAIDHEGTDPRMVRFVDERDREPRSFALRYVARVVFHKRHRKSVHTRTHTLHTSTDTEVVVWSPEEAPAGPAA